jgi:hypothetical protein
MPPQRFPANIVIDLPVSPNLQQLGECITTRISHIRSRIQTFLLRCLRIKKDSPRLSLRFSINGWGGFLCDKS